MASTSRVCFLLVIVTITVTVASASFLWPEEWLEDDNNYDNEVEEFYNPIVKRAMELEYQRETRGGFGPCRDVLTGKVCSRCNKRYSKYDHRRYMHCKSTPYVNPGFGGY